MTVDLHGLALSAPSDAAGAAFNETLKRYLAYEIESTQPLFDALAAEPDFAMGQCLKGYLLLLGFKQALVPVAAKAAAQAQRLSAQASARERLHAEALSAWVGGRIERALALWDQIQREHPTDLLAFRLAHFNLFWMGRPQAMLASVRQVRPHWHEGLAGWGTMLACEAFALEECGHYEQAERLGRAAVALDPADIWGTHAVAHVLEMQGRHAEGIDWLEGLRTHWARGSNLVHHLWWHRSLMHLAQGDTATPLALYDTRFRKLDSPLTQAQPDLYIDVQNAVSALYRLEHLGVQTGDRWRELADQAASRIGDCLSPFTLPHFMLALLADGREQSAREMLSAMREFGASENDIAPQVAEIVLPLCEAMVQVHTGHAQSAVDQLRPILPRLAELGGSHAQQEVLKLFCYRAAREAGSAPDMDAARTISGRNFVGGWASRAIYATH